MLKQPVQPSEEEGALGNFLTLLLLIALMGVLGIVTDVTTGPPHLPTLFPSWDDVVLVLRSSQLPPGVLGYVLGTAGWALLAYMTLAILLRVTVDLVGAIARENPLVRGLKVVSDHLTVPLVRKLIDGALVTITVAHLLGPDLGPAPAAASPIVAASVLQRPGDPGPARTAPAPAPAHESADGRSIRYLVANGDTLRAIARRFLGDELKWPLIWEANRGKTMSHGEVFSDPDLIRPSWELTIPAGEQPVHPVYVVEPGDALWSIAERELGNGLRWREIWALNDGRVMNDGLPFTDPRLIEPGWELFLPGPPAPSPVRPAPAQTSPPRVVSSARPPDHPTSAPVVLPSSAPEDHAPPVLTPATAPATVTSSPVSATPMPARKESPVLTLPDGRVIAATFGAALLGLLAYVARRRLLREILATAGEERAFAPGRFLSVLRQRFGAELETDKVAILANRLWVVLGIAGEHSALLLSCLEGRTSVILTFRCGHDHGQVSRLLDLAPVIAEELQVRVRAEQTGRDEVTLTVSGLSYRSMLSSIRPDYFHYLPLLCPLGATDDGRLLHLNLDAARTLLIAGVRGGGADELLRTALVTVAAQAHPRQVQLVLIGEPRGACEMLTRLPHLRGPIVDRSDSTAVLRVLESLQAELARRIDACQKETAGTIAEYNNFREESADLMPYLIVAIDGLERVLRHEGAAGALGTLCQEGPRYGIIVLAATTMGETLPEPVLDSFPTRIALRLVDEGQSLQVLGCPGAESLAPEGDVLLKLPDRPIRKMRGLRIEPDEISECVALMAAALGGSGPSSDGSPERAGGTDEVRRASELVVESARDDGDERPGRDATSVRGATDPLPVASGSPVAAPPDRSTDPATGASIPGGDRDERVPATRPADTEPVTDRVHVSCFGGFHVVRGGVELTGQNGRGSAGAGKGKAPFVAKARELLAYFVTHPYRELARERIQEDLWPDDPPEAAKKSFDNTLYRVRHALAGDTDDGQNQRYITQQDGSYQLQLDQFWIDAVEFTALLKRAEATEAGNPDEAARLRQQAVELYRGDYLDHCFYEWAERERDRLRRLYVQTLTRLAEYQAGRGELHGAIELLQRAVAIDSFNESLHRRLLQLFARASNWPAVLHHYEKLAALLQREMGAAPDRRTQELYRRLLEARDGGGRPAAPSQP